MNDFQKDILSVIKSAFTNEPTALGKAFDWERALNFVKNQSLDVMFFFGVQKSGVAMPEEYRSALKRRVMIMITHAARQDAETARVFELLKNADIDFLPLKGAILRNMYPEDGMRFMSDIDVLIRGEQYPQIEELMRKSGYDFVCESDHEYVWDRKNVLHIEFHKRLIPSYNKDYFAYYGDGWRLAENMDGSEYKMSDEDCFIYIFTHLAKHYRDSGIGLKHFVDVWVYLNKKPQLNREYIEAELKKLMLYDFYVNVIKTLKAWFGGSPADNAVNMITNWTFSGGTYGSYEKNVISKAVKQAQNDRNQSRSKRILKELFMPYTSMCERYPFLKKAPVLLPFMWCVRIIDALFFRRGNIEKKNNEINMMNDGNVSEFHDAIKLVGLDFNFKEQL